MKRPVIRLAPKKVIDCYDIASLSILAGVEDYTEGIYNGNSQTPYEQAQKNQHNYLLSQVSAWNGFKLLDVGCGNGTLLETAKERGVDGVGITVSESQVAYCQSKGLDVRLYNYKELPESFDGYFDGIIANGSLEHFVQPEDALNGKQDKIYEEMFEIFHRVIDPNSKSRRVATTSINFNLKVDPCKFILSPFRQLHDKEGFHFSVLYRGYGGFYPIKGQLEKCAEGAFKLLNEQDATLDYRYTSEHWKETFQKAFRSNREFRSRLVKYLVKKPIHTAFFVSSFFIFESWPWQFQGENPPTRLYRHTWEMVD